MDWKPRSEIMINLPLTTSRNFMKFPESFYIPCSARICLRYGPLSFLSTTCHSQSEPCLIMFNHHSESIIPTSQLRQDIRCFSDSVLQSKRMMSCLAGLVEDTQGLFGRRHLLRRTLDIGEGGDEPLKLLAKRVGQTHAAAQHMAKSQLVL